jgi:type II secretory pathway component HofQ
MTLADEARTLRERVAARLAELEPLVREYQELQRVADQIGLTASEPASAGAEEPAAPAAAAPQPAGADQQSRRASARRRQARAGQSRVAAAAERDARLLEAVSAHPGATVAEIATALGVDAVSLYRPVRDLASTGQVVKRGRGLFPRSD